jgi:hypothetical protein
MKTTAKAEKENPFEKLTTEPIPCSLLKSKPLGS